MANFTDIFDSFNGTDSFNWTDSFNGTDNQTGTTSNITLSPLDYNTTLSSISDDQQSTGYFYPFRWMESLVGLMGNVLVIIAVSRYEVLQTPTCYLLANLAGAGLVTASLTVLSVLAQSMTPSIQWLGLCIFKETLYVIAYYINILTHYMISIDRLICLTSRYRYAKYLTLPRTVTCQIAVWFGIAVICGLMFTLRSTATLSMPICIYSLLLSAEDLQLFMVYPYFFFTGLTVVNYIVLGFMLGYQGQKPPVQFSATVNQIQKRHRELTMTMGLLFVIYFILTVHMAVINLEVEETATFRVHLHYIGLLVWHINTCVNPILYTILLPKFKSAFRQILHIHSSSVAPVIIQMLNEEHYM